MAPFVRRSALKDRAELHSAEVFPVLFDQDRPASRLQYDFNHDALFFGVEFLYQHLDKATRSGSFLERS